MSEKETRQEEIERIVDAADSSNQERDTPPPPKKEKNPYLHGTGNWHRWEDKHKDKK